MKRGDIRNLVITGTFMFGNEGIKEPVHGWEDYARKLEDILIENNGVLPDALKSVKEKLADNLGQIPKATIEVKCWLKLHGRCIQECCGYGKEMDDCFDAMEREGII
jgi:hypothetical protein